ncbi:replication-relaxation family protein [Curtobacterium luteum]|uniref:replication-relaxation family protein n=1 Tax=Curtobacterium luteum TaxID=33881 RepID=UPI00382FFB91
MNAPYVPGDGLPVGLPLGSPSDPSFSQVRGEPDSPSGTNTPHPPAAEPNPKRVSASRLAWVDDHLPERDRQVLEIVAAHRYLTTRQLERFVFTGHASEESAARTSRRVLARLERLQLLASLGRRVGGVRAGSSATVWQLTSASARLLRADGVGFRRHDPSPRFLRHCLAVADVNLAVRSLAGPARSVAVQVEPESWRPYLGPGGERRTLQPDLAAELTTDEYEERWFLEVDLGTESLPTLLRQCAQYEAYRNTGTEQAEHGSFPVVWWILTDDHRAERLTSAIRRAPRLTPALYRVTTFDRLRVAIEEAAS